MFYSVNSSVPARDTSAVASAVAHADPLHDISTVAVTSTDTAITVDAISKQIDAIVANRHPLVFCGFSASGNKDPDKQDKWLEKVLTAAIDKYGAHNLIVCSGATSPPGITAVYPIAQRYGVEVMGIVSDKAKGADYLSPHCPEKNIVYVAAPENDPDSWEVLDKKGCSYMVGVATKHGGDMCFYGGGPVSFRELTESMKDKVNIFWNPLAEPDPENLKKAQEKRPGVDLTPILTYYKQHCHEGFGNNVTFID